MTARTRERQCTHIICSRDFVWLKTNEFFENHHPTRSNKFNDSSDCVQQSNTFRLNLTKFNFWTKLTKVITFGSLQWSLSFKLLHKKAFFRLKRSFDSLFGIFMNLHVIDICNWHLRRREWGRWQCRCSLAWLLASTPSDYHPTHCSANILGYNSVKMNNKWRVYTIGRKPRPLSWDLQRANHNKTPSEGLQ